MYRLQNNVPEYLINESRDFQLLCRIADCNNNGVKFSIDSVVRAMNTTTCGSGFLKLLESRLGFFTDGQYTDSEIRDILIGFCDMVKYKGSLLGIARAVRTFLVAKNIKIPTQIIYDSDKKRISIGLRSKKLDTSLLDDILRYVMPAGSYVYYFYYLPNRQSISLKYGQRVLWIFARDVDTSRVVSDYDVYTKDESVWYKLSSGVYKEYTPEENEKTSTDNMLSNVGFTNIYSRSTDQSSNIEPWSSDPETEGVINTEDDSISKKNQN